MVSLSINHKSACVLLTAFVVVLQIADDNDDDDDDDDGAFSANHISATRGLLVALTICICFYSRLQLRSSDAYGALALPWFLILHSSSSSSRMWLLTDVALLSSFSYIFLRRRQTSSRRSSTAQSSTRMSSGGTWLSRCDPIYSLAKMLARNAAGSKETELGVLSVSHTHLRAYETVLDLVCRLLLEKKNQPATYLPEVLYPL